MLVVMALLLTSCGDEELDPGQAAGTAVGATTADASSAEATTPRSGPISEESASEPISEASASEPSDDPTAGVDPTGEGDFCTQLAQFFDAWLTDQIGPVDLTGEYLRLADIAPGELVEHFQVLADGNEEALASGEISNQGAHDASGAAVAEYAMRECGIDLGA